MRVRESGMPPLEVWESMFDPPQTFARLALVGGIDAAVEFGCGYGTFTRSLARLTDGRVTAIDIDPAMVACTARRTCDEYSNVTVQQRDFVRDGTGLGDGSQSLALLFNILHAKDPVALLREARRVVRLGGRIAVTHWRYSRDTPRGPPLAIRPRPAMIAAWAEVAGLACGAMVLLPPWHYGYVLTK